VKYGEKAQLASAQTLARSTEDSEEKLFSIRIFAKPSLALPARSRGWVFAET